MSSQFYKLKVIAIDKPISDATTITFEVPIQNKDSFSYHPGQHLIIKFFIDGKEERRSYSLNSCPFRNEPLQVTVKRVEGGTVSNFVNDDLKVGEELEVMIPQGRFFADIKKDAYKTYFLFAAGSGITPIISILKSVLIASPQSIVNLFYGNKNQETIIFKEELEKLEIEFPKRLKIVQTLTDPKVWTTWEQWKGKKGRIDSKSVEEFISENPPIAQSTEYYICGPGGMNKDVRKTLINLGVPKNLIHIEQFKGDVEDENSNIIAFPNAQLSATLNDGKVSLSIPEGKTILQVLKEAEIESPYSCESGICGTCVAKVIDGKVEMKSCMALEEDEIKEGLVLTCQAIPTTKEVQIHFK